MLINLSYDELMQIASVLSIIKNVYATNDFDELLKKVNDAMDHINNVLLTDVYPGIFRGRGDSFT